MGGGGGGLIRHDYVLEYYQTFSSLRFWVLHSAIVTRIQGNNPLALSYLTRQPTISTEQSPSWEANSHSASQEIPAFYVTWRFITVFTTARHQSLSWSTWIQSTHSSRFCMIHFNIIIPLRPGLPCDSFLQVFLPILCAFLVSAMRATCLELITQASPASCHFLLLWSKYSLQHLFSNTPVYVLPLVRETKLHTHTKQQVKL
jgi:hypothetical protein